MATSRVCADCSAQFEQRIGRPASRCPECQVTHRKAYDRARSRTEYYGLTPGERSDRVRKYRIKSQYGITTEQYDALLAAQGGGCALCRSADAGPDKWGGVRRLVIDHDHDCCPGTRSCGGCIRGLLCQSCNSGIGLLRENADLLEAAAGYVREGAAWRRI